MKSIGREHPEEVLKRKNRKLLSLDDPFIVGNPHFTPLSDTMPDGVHAKPRHMWVQVYRHIRKSKLSPGWDRGVLGAQRTCSDLEAEYETLPEPRPDYLEWASEKTRPMLFRQLLRQALTGQGSMARIKGIATILEFTKSKPKQVMEVSQPIKTGEVADLFRELASLGGIPSEAAEAFIGAYLAKPNTAN